MRIESFNPEPIHRIEYLTISQERKIVIEHLELVKAQGSGLPEDVEGLLVTADLQGREAGQDNLASARLLGEVLAEELEVLASLGEIAELRATGVILAGDLFARPELDRRGGSGDVRGVWLSFANRCRWVAGVAGNHDVFGPGWSEPSFEEFKKQPGIHFLDGDTVELDGMKIGGLSGVVGNPRRPFRRSEEDFVNEVHRLAQGHPDIVVMHDGPDGAQEGFDGHLSVRNALETCPPTCVIRGHHHWPEPLVTLSNGTQVLNVDARAILVTHA